MESAPAAFRALNGIFCIFKPPNTVMENVVNGIKINLVKDLNGMQIRPPQQRVVFNEGNIGTNLPVATTVPDLADHPLVVGPRYVEDDIHLGYVSRLTKNASGVVVMGIGHGTRLLAKIAAAKYMRVYHVKGQLGTASLDFSSEGKIMQKTTYHHVTHGKIDKVVAAIQAGHQKNQFVAAGVDLQSQEAYEMAAQGLVRPMGMEAGPVLYGMKCIDFTPPEFTIEIHAINETGIYLMKTVHELGLELKSSAVCTGMRRLRYGHFTLVHALLRKHWHVGQILENIDFCRGLVTQQRLLRETQIRHVEESEMDEHNRFLTSDTAGYLPDTFI